MDTDALGRDSLAGRWARLVNLNCKRVLNEWWPAHQMRIGDQGLIDFGYLENNSKTGDYGPETRGGIRPAAQNVYALAVALFAGIYGETFIGFSQTEALQIVETVVSSLARDHLANGGIGHAWGNQWQSSQWASKCAMAGWLIWDELSAGTRLNIQKMIAHEADRLLKIPPPSANENYRNNTHAEENGWDATCLQTAVALLPKMPQTASWLEQSVMYRINAVATPQDMTVDSAVWGKPLKDWINGYNLDSLGALGNHSAYPHPDYMASALRHAIEGAVFLLLSGLEVPVPNFFHADLVYSNLTDYPWKGDTSIYRENGQIFWPIDQEHDWRFEYLTYGLVDAGASLFGFDHLSSVNGHTWEGRHTQQAILGEKKAFTSASAYLLHWVAASDAWHGDVQSIKIKK